MGWNSADCPHCREDIPGRDILEELDYDYDRVETMECPNCGKKIDVSISCDPWYNADICEEDDK